MKAIYLLILIINSLNSFAQPPLIQWERSYGGSENDYFNSIIIYNNNFYIIGATESNDFDVVGQHGTPPSLISPDVWLTVIDSNGNLQWNKCYGGISGEDGLSLVKSINGGFVLIGQASFNDGDVVGNHGMGYDIWVVNLNDSGSILWAKCYGGEAFEFPSSIIQTNDSNYLVVGRSDSDDHDITGNHGLEDMWALKIDQTGNIIWSIPYGGPDYDFTQGLQTCFQKNNGNFLFIGNSLSSSGQVSGNHGGTDIWVIEIDSSGQLISQKCFGGSQLDNGLSILPAGDGYYIGGITSSNNGDISNYIGGGDFWLAKVDSANNVVWNSCYGGLYVEEVHSMFLSNDGGVVLAGFSWSNDGQVTGSHGDRDIWVVKVDSMGNFEWGKALGGTSVEEANSIVQTMDGGYLVAGYSTSSDGDVSANYGLEDAWLVKLAPPGLSIHESQYDVMELSVSQYSGQVNARFFSRKPSSANLFIRDINGRVVLQKSIIINEGLNYQSLSAQFQSGIYVFQIAGDDFSVSELFVVGD